MFLLNATLGLLLVSLTAISSIQARTLEPRDMAQLMTVIADIAKHGDLSDLGYISNVLGLNLHVSSDVTVGRFARGAGDSERYNAVPRSVPGALYANGFEYHLTLGGSGASGRAYLRMAPLTCPDTAYFERILGVQSSMPSMTPHGEASSSKFTLPGTRPVEITATYFRPNGGCEISFSQDVTRGFHGETSPAERRSTGIDLMEALAMVAAHGELRDYELTARTLDLSLIPTLRSTTERANTGDRLLHGALGLIGFPVGIDPRNFRYWVNGTGYTLGHFSDKHPVAKSAEIAFSFDPDLICVSPSDARSIFQARLPKGTESAKANQYRIPGRNQISVEFTGESCVRWVFLWQRTADSKP